MAKTLDYDMETGEYFSRTANEFDGYDSNAGRDENGMDEHGGLLDMVVADDYYLENISVNTKGYYAGYITCYLVDEKNRYAYETLYRIHDKANGDDFSLVSVDYGWELGDDVIQKAVNVLTEKAKALNLDFDAIEEAQKAYKKEFDEEFNQDRQECEGDLFQKALNDCVHAMENVPESVPSRFPLEYVVTIERTERRSIGGYDTSKDTVCFNSLDSLVDFVKGNVSFNQLDDSVRLMTYELPVKVETGDGNVLFESDYRVNENGKVVLKETLEKVVKEKSKEKQFHEQSDKMKEDKAKKRDDESR